MAETTVDTSISTEELLNIKRSLQEVVSFYRKSALANAMRDEAAILVPIRATIQDISNDAGVFKDTLESYDNFTLDKIKPTSDITSINKISEMNNISGNFSVTPDVYENSKRETDFYMNAMKAEKRPSDGVLQTQAATGPVFSPKPDIPRLNPRPTDIAPKKYEGAFPNDILQKCIPCAKRITNLSNLGPNFELPGLIDPFLGFCNTYKKYLEGLLFNTDITNDICSILEELDKMCVPDLAAILSLISLSALQTIDIINVKIPLLGIISPIFAPIFGSLNSFLDRYIQLVMSIANCFANTLEDTLAKLDIEQGIRNVKANQERAAINLALELESRRAKILSSSTRLFKERRRLKNLLPTNDARVEEIEDQLLKMGITSAGEVSPGGPLERLNKEIKENRETAKIMRKANAEAGPTTMQDARKQVKDSRKYVGSSIRELKGIIYNLENKISEAAKTWIEEFEKFISFKSDSALSELETVRNIQRISRLAGIIRGVIQLAANSSNLKEFCKGKGDTQNFLGNFVPKPPKIFTGTLDGEPYMGFIHDEAEIQATQSTKPDTTNQSSPLRSSDLGDLANKKITAIIPETQIQVSPVIVPLNLCGKKGVPVAKEKIKDWIANLNS